MNTNKKRTGRMGLMAVMLALAIPIFSGCGTLDKAGVYNGDKVLYDADLVLATSYETLHSFVLFEYENRASLSGTPEIKQYADKVRSGAPQWIASAVAVRDAYKGNPGTSTASALQQSLDVLREAVVQATAYMAANASKATAPATQPPTTGPPVPVIPK